MEENNGEALEEHLPRTIDEAITLVLARMPEKTRAFLRRLNDEIDVRLQLAKGVTTGMSVRAMLGLWGKNPALLAQLPRASQHPDDASSYFLVECWRRLRDGRA